MSGRPGRVWEVPEVPEVPEVQEVPEARAAERVVAGEEAEANAVAAAVATRRP